MSVMSDVSVMIEETVPMMHLSVRQSVKLALWMDVTQSVKYHVVVTDL